MAEVLRAENVSKSFPGVLAVDEDSFTLERGEILALVGENGAGKTTLTQVLGGAHVPDSGNIILEGQPVVFHSTEDAIHAGISMVFQELSLVGSLSVAENIFANRQPVGLLNNIRWNGLYKDTEEFLNRFELDLDPKGLVKRLSMGDQQILEMCQRSHKETQEAMDSYVTSYLDKKAAQSRKKAPSAIGTPLGVSPPPARGYGGAENTSSSPG